MPKKLTSTDIDIINLRVQFSRELCQFTEKVNQIRRQAVTLPEDNPNRAHMEADALNIETHMNALEEALDLLG